MRALWNQAHKLLKHLKIFEIESLDLSTALKIAFLSSMNWKPIYDTLEGKWKRFGIFEVVQGKPNRAQSSIQIQFHIVGLSLINPADNLDESERYVETSLTLPTTGHI